MYEEPLPQSRIGFWDDVDAMADGATRTGGQRLRQRLRMLRYAGRRVECPCCGRRFGRFSTGPVPTDVGCPRCGSLPRQRLLWLYMAGRGLFPAAGNSVLHLAPEPILVDRLNAIPGVHYESADIDAGRNPTVLADLTDLPFDEDSFDLVLCSHVLEHVGDDRAAIAEMKRVAKPGGRALIQSPVNYEQAETFEAPEITDPAERLRLFSQDDHVRVYGPDLKSRLQEAGFEVSIFDAAELGTEANDRFGLVPSFGPLRNDIYDALSPVDDS